MRKWSGFKLATAVMLSGLLMLSGASYALADTDTTTATAGTTAAATGQQQSITIQQALTMAMANSNSLNSAASSVDQANNNLDTTQQQTAGTLNFTPSGSSTASTETALNNLTAADLNVTLQQSQYQASQDSVVYSVYQDYYNILQDETAQDTAQQALSLAALQQQQAVLEQQLGGYSQYQVTQADQSYAQAQTNLSTAEASLTTAYQQFDKLVGLATDDQPVLTDQPSSFTPLVVGSLDAEVSRVLADSPSILQAQNTVVADKTGLSVVSYVTSANYSSADSLNIAENNLATTETSVAQSERDMYATIQNLESKQNSLQQALATAEQNLQAIQVGYNVGYNDKLDLIEAQSTLATAQQNLLDNDCQHQLDVMLFETPWVSSGGSGS